MGAPDLVYFGGGMRFRPGGVVGGADVCDGADGAQLRTRCSLGKSLTEFEVPHRLRAFVRAREFSLILLAAVVGALAGIVVTLMGSGVDLLHSLFFGLPLGQRLSALVSLDPVLAMLVPTLGGVVLGIAYTFIAAWRPAREVDPIEANALHGGRMSFTGSVIVALQTVWSSGVGASVGMEAGYTQLASGIASRIGRAFRLRRADLRILVGCGAAGGIAGAHSGRRWPAPSTASSW
jgi:chloride channel protein, CIC family